MNNKLVTAIKKVKQIEAPEWAKFVKTGVSKERPPMQADWWFIRVSSILCKVQKLGPIGTNKLSKFYGSRKNRGHKPDKKYDGSRNIVRKCLQQLEMAGLIKQTDMPKAGKVLTKKGKELLNKNYN